MRLIAAVDSNWAIGNKGELLVSIPQDKKQFQELTMGGVILWRSKDDWRDCRRNDIKGTKNVILTRNRIIGTPMRLLFTALKKHWRRSKPIRRNRSILSEESRYTASFFHTATEHISQRLIIIMRRIRIFRSR